MRLLSIFGLSLAAILLFQENLLFINAELTPPYFNLATGRKIYATATCGVGVDEPELYCKLVGANTENDNSYFSVIQGQVCDTCDPSRPDKHHPPENAIDGTEAWWQSPPLSRGMKYNEVNLTIDFGQEFHVAYVFIRMANSPRPGLWTLEKSTDYGKTWTPWQHFSDTPADCEIYFGKDSLKPISKDDDVICTTEYSKIVPLENGEIPVMLLNNRPSANNYFNSTVLQEWTRATNVRIRLLRTKNLLGHLMSVARQDPTVTRRYFYSIKDISIGGRCMCNGHADTCDVLDPTSPVRILACRCQHRTCGVQCNECCPGFEQKKWRQNTNARPFQCEPCNCFGHSNRCIYDEEIDSKRLSLDIHGNYEGGGVCQDCQHNTDGINCNKCKPKFYRPWGKHWNETDVCRPCDCNKAYSTGNCEEETGRCECRPEFQEPDCQSCAFGYFGFPDCRQCECNLNGTDGNQCEAKYGRCSCKYNFDGPYCKQCAQGYFNYPECEPCSCNPQGTVNQACDAETGQCLCQSNFGGKACDRCKDGYFSYPTCKYCDCDVEGTIPEICNKETGQCLCREGYGGPRCSQCLPGYYNYPNCIPCNCSTLGSTSITCDLTGKCDCLQNFAGKQCNSCSAGFYSYPDCLPCNCNSYGSQGVSCNSEGQCSCLPNFDGKLCDVCRKGFYNFPTCEECNCDPAGLIPRFGGCGSVPPGELCQCKERVTGRICNQCKPLFWNLNISNPDGCEVCDCYLDGTISSLETCDTKTGQCTCKPATQGRQCKECKDGTYAMEGGSLFGCTDCNCDIGGSRNLVCDKVNGQCPCHQRITGRTCSQPLTTHYFPTLYQFQFEYEDGYTPSGAHVRYQYNESSFPGFSRKGYAVFSNIQNEVINEVNTFKSSVYRMVIRYHNPTQANVTAAILITSDNPLEVDQTTKVLFRPTIQPQFVTVSGAKGDKPSPIVLDPGRYTFSIKTDKNILLDYFVLLPAAYYEASILTRKIESPCLLDDLELCRHYRYPTVDEYAPVTQPLTPEGIPLINAMETYDDPDHMKIISRSGGIPILSSNTRSLKYPVIVPRTGRYVVVVDYVSHRDSPSLYYINVRIASSPTPDENEDYGAVLLYPCLYSMVCRQPVVDDASREKLFFIDETNQFPIEIYDFDKDGHKIPIVSVTAIPAEEWSVDFIKPSSVCVIKDSECVPSVFRAVPDSKKIELEHGHEARISPTKPAYTREDDTVKLIYLSHHNPTIEVQSKVSEPKLYVIIIQYYQPDHPKFQVPFRLVTSKQIYDGKFDVSHCPSSTGCRGLIRPETENMLFDIEDEFNITFTNNRPRGVWLDYILLVPFDQYNNDLLEEETFDQTKEFIRQCGQDHFHIQLNATEFCKKAVFSLTADYNAGALQCNCDYDGSQSFECDPFGGQCQCKPNVIGRRCEACRTGYWGFPDCKHCDCPLTALCEKDTGKCICPPHVVGEKCDQCEPYTYGFHQIIGCEECNCNELGVEGGNRQCDLNDGNCKCRPNIEGRVCDTCSNGYYSFPRCDQCRCNLDGTTLEVCDKSDGTCFCKKNVVGRYCDRCADGTYDLQKSNPEGCTKCFCFGKTTRCESAYLRVFNISLLNNVSLNTVRIMDDYTIAFETWDMGKDKILVNETTLQVDFSFDGGDEGLVYFGVLDMFASQNNHLTAYGGYLVYNLYYTSTSFGKLLYGPDILLYGKDTVLIHESYEQPSSSHHFRKTLQMVETNFQTLDKKPVSKADFMVVLRDLYMIYIRANYEEQTVLSQLSDVYLSIGAEDEENYNLYRQLSVERCDCPAGYTGLSCENCAQGYYRVPDGPYGGYCIPCQCHGHSDTCDCNTGKCLNCMHNTTGDHCEKCIEGYHGNATYGTPYDCMICACPLPYDQNNFATSCEISETGLEIHCECKPGYTGAQCESCAAGYYGQPRKLGDYCKPCDCSGNIDPTQPGACDTVTGECLLCLNNTYGKACNLCAPGYYGDAIKLKDCKACDCDDFGTAYCNSSTGICVCHENVIGERCDRCKPDHYGHASGLGCRPCACGEASLSTQCNDDTGDCLCKPGVTGRQCDHCAVDHWNYTMDGCIPCLCNKGFSRGFGCNALTGQCECLPGVIGEKCDACPHRWVLEKDRGCSICDVCHHALLNVTDDLYTLLTPVFDEFQTVARAHFTLLKLENYKSTAMKLQPKIESLDPTHINLNPARNNVLQLESEVKNLTKFISYGEQGSKDNAIKANKLLEDASDVLDLSRFVGINARNTIKVIENLAHSFDTSMNTKTENAKLEGETILEVLKMESIDLSPVYSQLDNSTNLLLAVDEFTAPVKQQTIALEYLKKNISTFEDKLSDLRNWSTIAIQNSQLVNQMNFVNKKAFDAAKFDTVENQTIEIDQNNEATRKLVINGNLTCNAIDDSLKGLSETFDEFKQTNTHADEMLPIADDKHRQLKQRIDNEAYPHAYDLAQLADDLAAQYMNIKENSEHAILAANAYSNIYDAVTNARKVATEAKQAAGNATELGDGLEERAGRSDQNARDVFSRAQQALTTVQLDLQPHLLKSTEDVERITNLNNRTSTKLTEINKLLEKLITGEGDPGTVQQSSLWNEANEVATDALYDARKTTDLLAPVVKDIDLDLEKAKNISRRVDNTEKDISEIRNQFERVTRTIPHVEQLTDSLEGYQNNVGLIANDIRAKIEDTKRQIEIARGIANGIKVGVTFNEKTVLELKTPETVPLLESHSKVSLYFNTSNPNGFLMYLGNDNKTGTPSGKNGDFMAIEIENGYPVLTIDLGNGPEKIINDRYVADGQWYQAVVDRTGNNVKFIIREQVKEGKEKYIRQHVQEKPLEGQFTVFNVDKNSRLFVGGYPSPDYTPRGVTKSSFQGQIEGLKIGDEEVGLWNFVDAANNRQGASERNTFTDDDIPATGYRFNGNGFVMISAASHNFRQRSRIVFRFKASKESSDGLMFYAGKHNHFIAVELNNGGIRYQYQMGQHLVQMQTESDRAFNDDTWHTVEAERDGRKGKLRVDDKLIYQEEAPLGAEEQLRISDHLYFGGVPGVTNHTEIVNRNFDGCIDNVTISGTTVDLSNNEKAYGVRAGCPEKFATTISFPPDQYGYLKKSNIFSYNSFQVHVNFKTLQREGIIFYAANYNQSATIGLTIHDGILRLRSAGVEVRSGPDKRYDDGQKYTVAVIHDAYRLQLNIDDIDKFHSDSPPPPLYITPGDIYFGGLPRTFKPPRNALSTLAYFAGCIDGATVNGHVVNFANTTERMSGYLDYCPPEMFNYTVFNVPLYYPGEQIETHIIPDQTFKPVEVPQPIPEYTTAPPQLPEEVTITEAPPPTQRRPPIITTPKPLPTTPSTPRPPPRIITESPKKDERECKLPVDPNYDYDDFTSGYRFGTKPYSRLEATTKVHKRYDITVEIRTSNRDGLIFYASDALHIDFFALYIRHGQLHHILRCGSETVNIESQLLYDDNQWHKVHFSRNNTITRLLIDDFQEYIGEPRCTKQMNIQTPLYFGGIAPGTQSRNITQEVIRNLNFEHGINYVGCIRNIQIGGKQLTSYSPHNVMSCLDDVETGVFFGHTEDSYVKLHQNFTVGTELTITFEMRPRVKDGLIMSVHGTKTNYLMLQLYKGALYFNVMTAGQELEVKFSLAQNESFCDGQWRKVQAIKSLYVITLAVNDISATPAIGNATKINTATYRPLFLGGHQFLRRENRVPGIKVRKPFYGCIRNVKIGDSIQHITPQMAHGDVWTGVCPIY